MAKQRDQPGKRMDFGAESLFFLGKIENVNLPGLKLDTTFQVFRIITCNEWLKYVTNYQRRIFRQV